MIIPNNSFSNNALANTSDIQDAINLMSYTNDRTLVLPPNLIPIKNLYCYYDPILNPGFNPSAKQGMINIVGSGTIDISYARNKVYITGTVLKSISTDLPAISFGNPDLNHNNSPYPTRKSKLSNITIVSNNTDCVIEAAGSPEMEWDKLFIIQENPNGNGLNLGSFWLGNIDKMYLINVSTDLIKSGKGIIFSNTIKGGGLFNISKSLIDGFDTGIEHSSDSLQFDNFNITESAIQGCNIGFNNLSRLISVNFDKLHFERCGIEVKSTASIDNLVIDKVYSSGRNGTTTPHIKLDGGVRLLEAKNINLRDSQSDYIELKKDTTSIREFIHVKGLNYFHDVIGTMHKPIVSISNNGNGKCRIRVDNHLYTTGRKVIISGTQYDGEDSITVIDNNFIDLNTKNYSTPYTSGGRVTLLCHAIKNVDNIATSNIKVEGLVHTDYGIDFVRGVY